MVHGILVASAVPGLAITPMVALFTGIRIRFTMGALHD